MNEEKKIEYSAVAITVLATILEGFEEDEVEAAVLMAHPSLIEAIEDRGGQEALDTADPSDLLGEPLRNEGYD